MYGDFDRVTFDPLAGFANVLLQQGRLLLPSDFNEQGAILNHLLRQLIIDLHGNQWRVDTGFEIDVDSDDALKFTIGKGHFYVDGLLSENDKDRSYDDQPFWVKPASLADLEDDSVVYLTCWERPVSWLQYARLREVALGGADTATRLQLAWQVHVASQGLFQQLDTISKALTARQKVADPETKKDLTKRLKVITDLKNLFGDPGANLTKDSAPKILAALDEASPLMAADAKDESATPEPCVISPEAEYRGRENQLYRVEIHDPGLAAKASFKWSRENGSVAFRVLDVVEVTAESAKSETETNVTLESLGRDRRTGLCEGDWVELIDEVIEFNGDVAPLLQVTKIDVQRRSVTLRGKAPAMDLTRHAILRRWDHHPDDEARGVMRVTESNDAGWIDLERGVKIRFSVGGNYRKGDYWLIPARTVTGDVQWPKDGDVPRPIPPQGPAYHRAALAVVTKSSGTWKVK